MIMAAATWGLHDGPGAEEGRFVLALLFLFLQQNYNFIPPFHYLFSLLMYLHITYLFLGSEIHITYYTRKETEQ